MTGWSEVSYFHNPNKRYELNYHEQKIRLTPTHDIRKHWTAVFDLIRSHQQCIPWSPPLEIEPAITEAKLYNWATNSHRTGDAKLTTHGNGAASNSIQNIIPLLQKENVALINMFYAITEKYPLDCVFVYNSVSPYVNLFSLQVC